MHSQEHRQAKNAALSRGELVEWRLLIRQNIKGNVRKLKSADAQKHKIAIIQESMQERTMSMNDALVGKLTQGAEEREHILRVLRIRLLRENVLRRCWKNVELPE